MSLLQCKNEKVSSLELLLNVNQDAVKFKSKKDKLSAVKKVQNEQQRAKNSVFLSLINEGKDSSLIKSIKSPSDALTAVLDRKTKKYYLQKRGFQKLLGHRVELYDP